MFVRLVCAGLVVRAAFVLAQPLPATHPVTPLLVSPSPGRPAFVAPGGLLRVVVADSGTQPAPTFRLVTRRYQVQQLDLRVAASSPLPDDAGRAFDLQVDATVPWQTYDLELVVGTNSIVARHAVAVGEIGDRLRIVHLGDLNIGDPGAPEPDPRLIDEVNLVAPDLIVATGNFVDALHPDLPRGWEQVADWLARFDAPVLAACGPDDDLAYFGRYLAPGAVGSIQAGAYRCVVLYDVPQDRLADDAAQRTWIEQMLREPAPTLLVGNAPRPGLLYAWQADGTLSQRIRTGHVMLWLSGGHTDWDGAEFGDVLGAAAPLRHVRTHQSSTATCGGASGRSHYRVVDLGGERVAVFGEASGNLTHAAPPSIAVGHLRVRYPGANDGSQRAVAAEITNSLPYPLAGARLRLLLKGTGTPWCQGGNLERFMSAGDVTICTVRVDLPEKSGVQVRVGLGAPPAAPVQVEFRVPHTIVVGPPVSRADGGEAPAPAATAQVCIVNPARSPIELTPIVRLDGDVVPYRVAGEDGPLASACRVRLAPGAALTLRLDFTAVRVPPGRRTLQVYLQGLPIWGPHTWPVEVQGDTS